MELTKRDSVSLSFSTRDLPAAERLPALREIFGRAVGLEFDARSDRPASAEMAVHASPGLRRTEMASSLTVEMTRPAHFLADNDDSVCLILTTRGHLSLKQRGQDSVAEPGDGLILLYREAAVLQFVDMNYSAVRVPFAALAALKKSVEAIAARRIPRDTEALLLLRIYLASMPATIADPELARLAATHVYDLIALAIGATDESRHVASQRGLRAARLEAIKADLSADAELKIDRLAARHGITPRYIQMLFEEAGTTFSAFVLDRRLETAHRMLTSPRYATHSVTEIAMEAGFGDLSHFNRRFKLRYGMTPSDRRLQAKGRQIAQTQLDNDDEET